MLETPRQPRRARLRAPGDRRRRRPLPGRGVRPLRHRPRAVHRPAPPRPALRPRSRDRRDRRGGRRPAAAERWGGAAAATGWRCRCSSRAGPATPADAATTATASGTGWPRCTGSRAPRSRRASGAATPPTTTSGPTRCSCPSPTGSIRCSPRCSTRSGPASSGASRSRARRPATGWPSSGPGIRGLSVCAAAKDAGAEFVMVTGAGERDHPRLETAERFGADLVVDVTEADPVAAFRRATGSSGADVVVDVTAKAPSAFAQGVALTRAGGTFVVAGIRGEPDPRLPRRPPRLQGAAHHRRPRRGHRRLPRRPRPARRRPLPVRRPQPAGGAARRRGAAAAGDGRRGRPATRSTASSDPHEST